MKFPNHILSCCMPVIASAVGIAGERDWTAKGPTAPSDPGAFWGITTNGSIVHDCSRTEPMILCMQGRKVLVQVQADHAAGVSYKAGFYNIQQHPTANNVIFESARETSPVLLVDDEPLKCDIPASVTFDGIVTFTYPATRGVIVTRMIYPSMTKAVVVEEWQIRNASSRSVRVEVASGRKETVVLDAITIVWGCQGVRSSSVKPGTTVSFAACVQARLTTEPVMAIKVAAERAARRAVAEAAWHGPGRLETPEPQIDLAFTLQKLHVLEDPIETFKGLITHNGSLTYSPGIWANDPAEYSSPLFPFFGNADLNRACMNMYHVWQGYCQEKGTNAIPGAFWKETLQIGQWERGDDAMILYGLSKFLLFQGDRDAATELWPLIEFSAASVLNHTTPDGIVASDSDEMEGRYPTGKANLSTSSLAYGGYRQAARVAHALGKPVETVFDKRADALAKAIESYFGGEIEGFKTYRYYKENTTLRGWILLPLAMGITNRQDGTLAALLSDKLWPNRMTGGDILAETGRKTEWGRETYYALRVLFKAGRTEEAIDLTRRVVTAQIFGPNGPYPDEDAIDMLCPGSLYPRVFTEGLFGIVPTGFDSFTCTPWLPKDWPRMALRDVRAFGRAWDLVVEREGNQQKVTVTCEGKIVATDVGQAGKTHEVKFPR